MSRITAQAILQYLDRQRPAITGFLASLVRQESPSRVPEAQAGVMKLLSDQLKELDYHVLHVPGRQTGGYLFARPRQRQRRLPVQLLIGHCDTVWQLGTLRQMPLEREKGRMKGPGVYDMKAGLTQILFALQTIRTLALQPSVTPVVLINSDEEIGSKESTPAIRRLARIADRAYILEPPLGLEGRLKTARKGIGHFELIVRGKAAHAGLDPEKGASAIMELSHQIQRLFAMNDPERGITVNVGMIEGGTATNVIASESRAKVDVRVLNKADGEEITRQIHALQAVNPNTELIIRGSVGRPPLERTPRNRQLWYLAQKAGSALNIELEEGTAGGGSDGNTTSLYTATLDGLGTVGDGAHAVHEFIFMDKLIERTALLTLLLLAPAVAQRPSSPARNRRQATGF